MDIFDLLHRRDIVLSAPARAKRSLLRLLAHTLSARCGVPADSILAALLNREKLGSTGIGHGIAVPHALMKSLSEPAAALAVLDPPVQHWASDEQPVDVVLAAIWPGEHVGWFTPALARSCRRLACTGALKSIRNAATADEVLECLRRLNEARWSPPTSSLPGSSQPVGATYWERRRWRQPSKRASRPAGETEQCPTRTSRMRWNAT